MEKTIPEYLALACFSQDPAAGGLLDEWEAFVRAGKSMASVGQRTDMPIGLGGLPPVAIGWDGARWDGEDGLDLAPKWFAQAVARYPNQAFVVAMAWGDGDDPNAHEHMAHAWIHVPGIGKPWHMPEGEAWITKDELEQARARATGQGLNLSLGQLAVVGALLDKPGTVEALEAWHLDRKLGGQGVRLPAPRM